MTRLPMSVVAVLATAALSVLAACASAPLAPAVSAPTDCVALAADIASAADAQRVAELERDNAWKTPLPFAAAARLGHGMVGASQAQQRLDELRSQASGLGCEPSDAMAGNGVRTTARGQGLRAPSSLN